MGTLGLDSILLSSKGCVDEPAFTFAVDIAMGSDLVWKADNAMVGLVTIERPKWKSSAAVVGGGEGSAMNWSIEHGVT